MGNRHQVGFRRQLISRITPIAVGERPELPGLHESLQSVLNIPKISWRGKRPTGNALGETGRRLRARLKRIHHIDPVQGMQMVKMHQMVMHLKGQLHNVANGVGILRDTDAEGIFHRTH